MAHNAHHGFKAAARSIGKREGISIERAAAELAAGARRAGEAAPKANSRLKRVEGG
jgi:hypothetical protein